jgi:CDP-diacylglycerol--glycerol-3-phosphate 3-phosphatidyltransferase
MNTPNKITLSRFFFAIVMIIIYCLNFLPNASSFAPMLGTSGFNWIDLVCAIVFTVGAITDSIDGHLARKHHLVTNLGKFLDPLADKFLVDSALILLATKVDPNGNFYLFPAMVVLFVGRDLAMDGLRMIANSKGRVLAANIYGKIKTVLEMVAIPVIFLNGFPFNYCDFQGLGNFQYTYVITNCLAFIALAMSLISCFIYFKQNYDVLKEEGTKK